MKYAIILAALLSMPVQAENMCKFGLAIAEESAAAKDRGVKLYEILDTLAVVKDAELRATAEVAATFVYEGYSPIGIYRACEEAYEQGAVKKQPKSIQY